MATDPINELLEAIKGQLQPLVSSDKLRVLVRSNDIQPITPGELQIIYTGSAPSDTFDGSVEQAATLELYLATQNLIGPQGAYALIPQIVSLLKGFEPFEGYGCCKFRGDQKSFADEQQRILIFTLTFAVSTPPF